MCDCTILIFGLTVVFLDLCLYFKGKLAHHSNDITLF